MKGNNSRLTVRELFLELCLVVNGDPGTLWSAARGSPSTIREVALMELKRTAYLFVLVRVCRRIDRHIPNADSNGVSVPQVHAYREHV